MPFRSATLPRGLSVSGPLVTIWSLMQYRKSSNQTVHSFPFFAFVTVVVLGCTGSSSLGCGSSGGSDTPDVSSDLPGIYTVDSYQQSEEDACDTIAEVDPAPARIVLYGAESESVPGGVALAGQFCGSVEDCRFRVAQSPFATNYAFLRGDDTDGWQGWGIASRNGVGDECLYEVQEHTLTAAGEQAIRIDTREVVTQFQATDPGDGSGTGTCTDRAAIDAITPDSPCKQVFLLEASFEEQL